MPVPVDNVRTGERRTYLYRRSTRAGDGKRGEVRWLLVVPEGRYTSRSLLGLVVRVAAHRLHHLLRGDGWKD
jgi:hypothetical protein